MCREHQLLQHLATTHTGTHVHVFLLWKVSASTHLPTGLCSAHQEDCALASWLGGFCWTQGSGGAGLWGWEHHLACSEERGASAPPLGPVTPGASGERPGKKPLKHLPCSIHSYSTSHISGFSCRLASPLLLDRKVFPQRICPDLGLVWFSYWTWKVFLQRLCLDPGLGWYRCNRQYVQGSGKLVLKLPGFRATAPPHLHPFHSHGASLPEEGVCQHQPQRH